MFTAIGMMTGSSMDGIDGALIQTDGIWESHHIYGESISYTPELIILLRMCEYAAQHEHGNLEGMSLNFKKHAHDYLENFSGSISISSLEKYLECKITIKNIIQHLTILHCELAKSIIRKSGIESLDIIGFHGQNLYHNPNMRISLQIGDGKLMSDLMKTSVATDFRSKDILNGGKGAPLAPMYHRVLAKMHNSFPTAIVNCGGISNISFISGIEDNEVIGFDAGPGNILIDRYIRHKTTGSEFMDYDGKYGLQGVVSQELLPILYEKTIQHSGTNFFTQKPPKALDAKNFILIPELNNLKIEDACATLEYFTADSLLNSFNLIETNGLKNIVLCGGGWKNPVIKMFFVEKAQKHFGIDVKVTTSDEIGWKSQYIEAEIFAYLAVRSKLKLPTSIPSITGASMPTIGGVIYEY